MIKQTIPTNLKCAIKRIHNRLKKLLETKPKRIPLTPEAENYIRKEFDPEKAEQIIAFCNRPPRVHCENMIQTPLIIIDKTL